jgi:hypothetical protein
MEDDVRYMFVDPGKNPVLAITDGLRHMEFNVDKRQRARAAMRNLAREDHRHLIQAGGPLPLTVAQYETSVMAAHTKKSCTLATFLGWLRARVVCEAQASRLYRRPIFRQDRFNSKCLQKSAEQKIANKLRESILGAEPKARRWMQRPDLGEGASGVRDLLLQNANRPATKKTRIVLLYGSWAGANLRGSAPTPGIGLRRRIHHMPGITTITVPEPFTSKTCPVCDTRTLSNPNLRVRFPDQDREAVTKHHLLCCSNSNCPCRWWDRNVAGSLNIGLWGLRLLMSHEHA